MNTSEGEPEPRAAKGKLAGMELPAPSAPPPAKATASAPASELRARVLRVLAGDLWVLGLAALYFLVLLPFVPDLANPENLEHILSNALPLLVVATGQTFVLITGGIDLSITSIIALASVAGAATMTGPLGAQSGFVSVPLGIAVMALVGAGIGVGNGLAITRLRMPPFMVTLTSMLFVSGFAIWTTKSNGIYGLPEGFADLAQGAVAGVLPYALLPAAALALVAHVGLTRTLFGRRLFAVGVNAKAARVSGVPVERTILLAYVASGLSAGLASVLYTGRLETGSPVLGRSLFLDVIGATVIGGTSLFGGKGSIAGTAFGVLFITLIDDSLNLMGLSNFAVLIAKGIVILLAALFDAWRTRALHGRA